jgi:hypothetical protein
MDKPKYLNKEEIDVDVSFDVVPQSQGTYNESELLEEVKKNPQECFMIGLSFAIIGAVKGNYGTVKTPEKEYKVSDLLQKVSAIHGSSGDKLEAKTITPKRMARLFRFKISEYIKQTGRVSFLVRKYNPAAKYPHLCFPGAEYMVNEEESEDLKKAYAAIDNLHQTKFLFKVTQIVAVRHMQYGIAAQARLHEEMS